LDDTTSTRKRLSKLTSYIQGQRLQPQPEVHEESRLGPSGNYEQAKSAFQCDGKERKPNTPKEHTRIGEAGGATTAEARRLVAQSLKNLQKQGVRIPTNIL
jgi:hypothetical protein